MRPEFEDHFSVVAGSYTRYRPSYPSVLFDYLAREAPGRERAWDCATGGGQAAIRLAERFEEVWATDASPEQIENAVSRPNVRYSVAAADASGLEEKSVELVTVAQAMHWLPFEPFYAEARRVLKPRGIVAVWSYDLTEIGPRIDPLIRRLSHEIVGDCWPPERAYVHEGYRTIPFPFDELPAPRVRMTEEWNLDHLRGYLATWSAVWRYRERTGEDALASIDADLRRAWGDASRVRTLRWPLHLRVGRV
jgi:SAM-dependent methyltransferase